MPNYSQMSAKELGQEHRQNLIELDKLKMKNLDNACAEIFFMQPLVDFLKKGILSKTKGIDNQDNQIETWLKSRETKNRLVAMMELEEKAVNIIKLGCKLQENKELTIKEWETLEADARRVADITSGVMRVNNFTDFDETAEIPLKQMIAPAKDGKDLYTLSAMMGSYALSMQPISTTYISKETGLEEKYKLDALTPEQGELNSLVSALDARVSEYVYNAKKEVRNAEKQNNQELLKEKESELYNAMQMKRDCVVVMKTGYTAIKPEEWKAYANKFVDFVEQYKDHEAVGFVKNLPAFEHVKANFINPVPKAENINIINADNNANNINVNNINVNNNNIENNNNININIIDNKSENNDLNDLEDRIEDVNDIDGEELNDNQHKEPEEELTEEEKQKRTVKENAIKALVESQSEDDKKLEKRIKLNEDERILSGKVMKYNDTYGVFSFVRNVRMPELFTEIQLDDTKGEKIKVVNLNGMDSVQASGKREELSFNIDRIGATPEKSAVLYGMLEGWKKTMAKDLETFRELLENTQDNPDANFNSFRTEGPRDYQQLAQAISNCRNLLNTEGTSPNRLLAAFTDLKKKEDKYVSKHTPVWRDHTSEQTAERFKIIQSMSELTAIHNNLFKDTLTKLNANMKAVAEKEHNRADRNLGAGDLNFRSLKQRVNAPFGQAINDDPDNAMIAENNSKKEELNKLGQAAMESAKNKAEKKMLTDRFVRKTGLDTEEKRINFDPYRNPDRDVEIAAKNFLAQKYLKLLNKKDMELEDVIGLNEQIRVKPFEKELKSLSNDRYFEIVVRKNPKDWVTKWAFVDELSEQFKQKAKKDVIDYSDEEGLRQLYDEIDDILNPREKLSNDVPGEGIIDDEMENNKPLSKRESEWKAHTVLAEHLVNIAITKPENADVLHMLANTPEEDRDIIYEDVADYLMHISAKLPDNPNKLQNAVKDRMSNSLLASSVARRVRNYYETYAVMDKESLEFDVKTKFREAVREAKLAKQAGKPNAIGNVKGKPSGDTKAIKRNGPVKGGPQ